MLSSLASAVCFLELLGNMPRNPRCCWIFSNDDDFPLKQRTYPTGQEQRPRLPERLDKFLRLNQPLADGLVLIREHP